MTVAVETVTYQRAQHSATAAAASGSHGRVGERGKRNFSQGKGDYIYFFGIWVICLSKSGENALRSNASLGVLGVFYNITLPSLWHSPQVENGFPLSI